MKTVQSISALRNEVALWRGAGARVGLVPTMGNLHAGHLQLVEDARERSDRVVVSIFVNPTQFPPGEDYAIYPSTPDEDQSRLEAAGVDLLFMPPVGVIYPGSPDPLTRVSVRGLSSILCGASRPGHFDGVATVVCKLFNMVQPDLALFGEKDFQQLMVIRQMTEDLDIPVEILSHPTVREEDGLAMSSRNGYLTDEERKIAPHLYRLLGEVATLISGGALDLPRLEQTTVEALDRLGFKSDYVAIRRADNLRPPTAEDRDLVILAAAHLGKARLIDNLSLQR